MAVVDGEAITSAGSVGADTAPFALPQFHLPWPALLNPHVESARAHTNAWAKDLGMIDQPARAGEPVIWTEDAFEAMDFAGLCAYTHPECPPDELDLITDWYVWVFYFDDHFLDVYKRPRNLTGAREYLDGLLAFMPVDLSPPPAPIHPSQRALAELWWRTCPSKSVPWRERFRVNNVHAIQESMWELVNIREERVANPIEYIEARRRVGGAPWSANLVEHARFVEVPPRLATTRPLRVLTECFSDAVHLCNDIFSYQREVEEEGEKSNSVLVAERLMGYDPQAAADLVSDLITSRLEQFENTVRTELAPLFSDYAATDAEQVAVLSFAEGLRHWQAGGHEWHQRSSRYMKPGDGPPPPKQSQARARTPRSSMYDVPALYLPFPVRVNDHLDEARERTADFARRTGIGQTAGLPAQDHAARAAMCRPEASLDALVLAADWLAWADHLAACLQWRDFPAGERQGGKAFLADLAQFLLLDPAALASATTAATGGPIERGLADVWSRTPQRNVVRSHVVGMLDGWRWELANREQARVPDPLDAVEMRRRSTGSTLWLALATADLAAELPHELLATSTMGSLLAAAADVVGFTDDLLRFCGGASHTEIDSEVPSNTVVAFGHFRGSDAATAADVVHRLRTARTEELEWLIANEVASAAAQLGLVAGTRSVLDRYVGAVQDYVAGSVTWLVNRA